MMDGLLSATTFVLLLHGMTYVDARAVGCGGKPADVVFMLDASNSIWGPDFRKQLHFVKDVVDWFTIGRNEMRVSVITYADYPQLQFHLHYYFTKDQLWTAVDNIRQNGGYHTITADALRYARQNVLGGRGDHIRENVTKVIVVITDGLSDNRTATALEAARTKDAGIHVFAVGVGKDVDLEELDTIASQPSMYYTFLVDGYEGLSNIRELLAIKTCTVTDPPTTTTTTTTTTYQPTTATSTTTTTPISTTSRDASNSADTTPGRAGKDGDDPYDKDGETLRTPVILQPPTFLPFHTEKPVAELIAPPQTNCSRSTETQENSTKDGQGGREKQEDPQRPCGLKRGDGSDPNQTGKPNGGNGTDPNQTGNPKGINGTGPNQNGNPKGGNGTDPNQTGNPKGGNGTDPNQTGKPKGGNGTDPNQTGKPEGGNGTDPNQTGKPEGGNGTDPNQTGKPKGENNTDPDQTGKPEGGDGTDPNQTGKPEGGNGTDPNQTGKPEGGNGTDPNQTGKPEGGNGTDPNQNGNPKGGNGTDPNQTGKPEGGDGTDPNQTGKPEGGDGTNPNQTGGPSRNDSENGPSKGMWLYNEHGYVIGSRFVKLKNKTTDVNESDAQTLTEAELPTIDTNVVPEVGLNNITLEVRRTLPDPPHVDLYFDKNLLGLGGYWYYDERLGGYVWYRYISPGVFELDLETTNQVRGPNQALEGPNIEKVVTAPSLLSREPTSPPSSFQSTTQVPSGYWGRDEHGYLVWHRYIKAGVYQTIYPVTKTEAEHAVTMRSGSQASTDSVAGARPLPTARSQTAAEGHSGSTKDGGYAEPTLDEVELDFWKFITGKSVSVQYVPPNDIDEDDEEYRFPGAVDMPPIQAGGSAAGTGRDFRYSEEKRRVWHSSSDLKSGPGSKEEISVSAKDADENETMSVRLDNEKGRELWQQLVNLTGGKLDQSKFPSEMKNRFGVIRGKLPEKQEGSNNSDKPTDHDVHESYWFTDETGRRFQVIHKYNPSDNDEARQPLHGNDGLDPTKDNRFPVGRNDADENVRYTQTENEEHGLHHPDAEGAVEYEKYGGEYWIRIVSSSQDGAARKPNKSPSIVPQPRSAPHTPSLRHITTRPLPPQELRGGTEKEVDQTQKKGNPPNGKQGKGKGDQKPVKKNTKQKGLPVSGEKKEKKGKTLVKGCRSRKPMDVIITIDRRAKQTSYANYMVNISQIVAAKLNNTQAVGGVQVKFYPEIRNTLEPGHVVKAENWTQTNEPPAVTLVGLSNILRKDAALNKRSGRKRSRPIIVYITDGRPAVGMAKDPKRKTPTTGKIGKDVELYVVGVGEETNREDLEAIARLSPSKSKTHVFHRLNPHSNISNLNDISVEILSAVCRS